MSDDRPSKSGHVICQILVGSLEVVYVLMPKLTKHSARFAIILLKQSGKASLAKSFQSRQRPLAKSFQSRERLWRSAFRSPEASGDSETSREASGDLNDDRQSLSRL